MFVGTECLAPPHTPLGTGCFRLAARPGRWHQLRRRRASSSVPAYRFTCRIVCFRSLVFSFAQLAALLRVSAAEPFAILALAFRMIKAGKTCAGSFAAYCHMALRHGPFLPLARIQDPHLPSIQFGVLPQVLAFNFHTRRLPAQHLHHLRRLPHSRPAQRPWPLAPTHLPIRRLPAARRRSD